MTHARDVLQLKGDVMLLPVYLDGYSPVDVGRGGSFQ